MVSAVRLMPCMRWHKLSLLSIAAYRVPMDVDAIRLLAGGESYPICPRCGITMDREYMAYCDRCGQRLGWERIDLAAIVTKPRR